MLPALHAGELAAERRLLPVVPLSLRLFLINYMLFHMYVYMYIICVYIYIYIYTHIHTCIVANDIFIGRILACGTAELAWPSPDSPPSAASLSPAWSEHVCLFWTCLKSALSTHLPTCLPAYLPTYPPTYAYTYLLSVGRVSR